MQTKDIKKIFMMFFIFFFCVLCHNNKKKGMKNINMKIVYKYSRPKNVGKPKKNAPDCGGCNMLVEIERKVRL